MTQATQAPNTGFADAPIKTVAVLGAGQMGGGIAHVCALAGLAVGLFDSRPSAPAVAIQAAAANMRREAQKGGLAAEAAERAAASITPQSALGAWLQEADFAIEAISEDRPAKLELFAKLGECLRPDAVLASNTSSYSIGGLAKAYSRPQNFIGMHFMNPPPKMPLVEVIAGAQTSGQTLAKTLALARQLGKQTAVAADQPGFIANRILLPMLNEAFFALQAGAGGVEDIDRAMTLGMRHPMGPLALADLIGLDTCLEILNTLRRGFDDKKFCPCPLLQTMTAAGELGKKSGVGFYDYRNEGKPRPAARFA